MRYELKEETPGDPKTQWLIWDTVENRAFARFADRGTPEGILSRYNAAQLAAESA
jgi:hypothetical protein